MNTFNSIAIIGMSGRLPMISSLDELDDIFSNKVDTIRPVSENRIELQKLDKNKIYKETAYLDDIEFFDYPFFNISKNEAQYIDPQQRIAMQLACEAIENSGYSLSSMKGSNTSVLVAAHDSYFLDLLENPSGPALIGNFLDVLPARISYFLDLRGEATVIQTSCSSSLTAIYDACIKLNAYETDMVLVGAVCLDFRINEENKEDKIGIYSGSNRCKSFDEDADGTNFGEGAGFILLKRFDDAINDKDNILAEVKSVGINQDGSRSNSLTAPSAAAQAELLLKTWERGGINPEDIGYIEAHGTGTKIGDPIEILGITKAVSNFTDKKEFCPIGSLKSNFSHFGSFAGLANILKGIISIQNGKKYPLQNFKAPNQLIDFKNSPVYPITEVEEWYGGKSKLFATSAFGISGTNVHVVLGEYDSYAPLDIEYYPEIVTVSVKYEEVYETYRANLQARARICNSYAEFCYTLNSGRDPYSYRVAAVVSSREELIEFLSTSKVELLEKKEIVFLCSDNNICEKEEIRKLCENSTYFNEIYSQFINRLGEQNENTRYLVQNVSLYRFLKRIGIESSKVIGSGKGNIVVDYLTDKIDFEEAASKISTYSEQGKFNEVGFLEYVKKQFKEEDNFFLELGNQGIIESCLDKNGYSNHISALNETGILAAVGKLYCLGCDILWNKYYEGRNRKKMALPTHPFRNLIAWPVAIKSTHNTRTKEDTKTRDSKPMDIYAFLHELWCEQLGVDEIKKDDDLFELGADSLMGMDVVENIEKNIGIKIEFEAVYKYPTLEMLGAYLLTLKGSGNEEKNDIISYIERHDKMLVSYNQKRMLYLFEESNKSSSYNMPCMFKFKGDLNESAFLLSVCALVQRNESLHTIYTKNDGEYYQRILNEYELVNELIDLSSKSEPLINETIRNYCDQSFDLFREIPVRSYLIKVNETEHIWLVNTHHIAADGWSMGIVCNEICKIYKSALEEKKFADIPPQKNQYVDYAYWENALAKSDDFKKQVQYWTNLLKGVKGISNVPTDKVRPSLQTYAGSTHKFSFGKELTNLCKIFSKQKQLSLFTLLETIFAITLSKISGDDDLCIGVPVANRKDKNSKNVIGFYSNTIVVRNMFKKNQSIWENLNSNKDMLLRSFDNTDVSFEEVVRNVEFKRNPAYSPLFQHAFAYQNYGVQEFQLPGVTVDIEILDFNAAKFDMSMTIFENEKELHGLLEYNTDLYYSNTITNLLDQYLYYIKYCVEKSEVLLTDLPVDEKQVTIVSGEKEEEYSF
ncbi:condensation domain-containing protein [Lachnospiraceae bacterium ZAX-1]